MFTIVKNKLRGAKVYTDFADNVARLVEQGLYTPVLTEKYSQRRSCHSRQSNRTRTGQAIHIYRFENTYGPLCRC